MLKINKGYIIVKEISFDSIKANFHFDKKHHGESRFAIVIGSNKNSSIKTRDTIIHDKCISYFPAKELGNDCYYIKEEDVTAKIINGDIISFRESVYVKVNKEANYSIEVDGVKMDKDVEFNEFALYNRTQHGIVVAVPLEATNSYLKGDRRIPIDLKVGDTIYSHHFLTHKDNERIINGERVFEIRYEECYCRERNGEITMLNEWNFIEPIDEDDSKFMVQGFQVKEKKEKETSEGIIKYISEKLRNLDASINDKVLFKNKRDYPIIVQDNLYYRVNTRDIVAFKTNKNEK